MGDRLALFLVLLQVKFLSDGDVGPVDCDGSCGVAGLFYSFGSRQIDRRDRVAAGKTNGCWGTLDSHFEVC